MKIDIKKAHIYDEAGKVTAYIGARSGEYKQVAITVNEHQALDTFWYDGCNNVTNILKRFVTGISPVDMHHPDDAEVFTIILDAPHIDANMEQTIVSTVSIYMINYIVSQWLNICSSNDAKIYEAKAANEVEVIKRMIYHRKMPVMG